jgi:hypothetical protein
VLVRILGVEIEEVVVAVEPGVVLMELMLVRIGGVEVLEVVPMGTVELARVAVELRPAVVVEEVRTSENSERVLLRELATNTSPLPES